MTRLVDDGFDPRGSTKCDSASTTIERRPRATQTCAHCSASTASTDPSRCTPARANRGRTSSACARRTPRRVAGHPELGPLVIVGPAGWGGVDLGDAVVLGLVSRAMLKGLYRDARSWPTCRAPRAGGCRPMEALHEGARVVASATTPSAPNNPEVVLVDPLDVSAIAAGLVAALDAARREPARGASERGRSHVAQRGPRSPGELAMKVALDVSAVPLKVAGAGRYIVEIARRLPARGVETTLVTRRDDTERWRALSPNATLAPLVPDGRVARLATEAMLLGRARPRGRATSGTVRTTRCRTPAPRRRS